MSETVQIRASQAAISPAFDGGLVITAYMTTNDMRDAIKSVAKVMPGDKWRKLMDEINGDEPCQSQQ